MGLRNTQFDRLWFDVDQSDAFKATNAIPKFVSIEIRILSTDSRRRSRSTPMRSGKRAAAQIPAVSESRGDPEADDELVRQVQGWKASSLRRPSITRATPRGLVVVSGGTAASPDKLHRRVSQQWQARSPEGEGLGRARGETRDKFNMTLARRQSTGGRHADATALRVDARPSFSLHRVHVRHQRSDHRLAKLKMGHLHPFMADNDTFGERFL